MTPRRCATILAAGLFLSGGHGFTDPVTGIAYDIQFSNWRVAKPGDTEATLHPTTGGLLAWPCFRA